jgi:hypothetical protein
VISLASVGVGVGEAHALHELAEECAGGARERGQNTAL